MNHKSAPEFATCHPSLPAASHGLCANCCSKLWYKEHRQKVLAQRAIEHNADPEYWSNYKRNCRRNNLVTYMYVAARARARKRGLDFTITREGIVIPDRCPIFGMPLIVNIGKSGFRGDSPSLDRVDSSRGYVPGNVAVISKRANIIKNLGTAEEHRKIADWMEKKLRKEI